MEKASFCAKTPFSPMKKPVFPLKKACFRGRMPYFGGVFGAGSTAHHSFEVPMAAKKKASKRKPNAAFMKPMTPDAVLAEVVGDKAIPRTEVTKKLWQYIKRKGLQDKKNRRMINADASLKPVFNGKSQVSMFEMTKLVNKHMK